MSTRRRAGYGETAMRVRRERVEWIFGYGSLVGLRGSDGAEPDPTPAALRGYRRSWDVAMDNDQTIPGYKAFVDPHSGEQPPVFVTFLNIQADPDAWINGALIPVHESALESIDRRERNYDRRDVTAALDADLDGPVWAYLGSDDGR